MTASPTFLNTRFATALASIFTISLLLTACVPNPGPSANTDDVASDLPLGEHDAAADAGSDAVDPDSNTEPDPYDGLTDVPDNGSSNGMNRDIPTLNTINTSAATSCLVGTWFPDLDQWMMLRSQGLQAEVTVNDGGFVLFIDPDLNVIRENYEFKYQIQSSGARIQVNQAGTRAFSLEMLPDGAVMIPDSIDASQERTVSVVNGEDTYQETVPPIVFDRFKMQCEGDEITLHNPFGKMRLGREH